LKALSDVEDEDIFDKYKLNELCVYPRKEIKKLIEHISKVKSIKTATDSECVSLKSRMSGYELKLSESESEVYKITFNIEQLRKQNELLIKNFDSFKEQKEKEIKKLAKEHKKVLGDLRLKNEKLEKENVSNKKRKNQLEGENLNIIRRKEHSIQNMKTDLANLESKLKKANQSLLEQNERYETLYKEFKGR
jgi:chromosome segregation ATPase